mmetsp:Transcript_25300/g.63286  ORF Transcript_25300/g.63286 Transcript_25300/m.63286 type:complete len:85 (+) Transcript_25300:229-483(+)
MAFEVATISPVQGHMSPRPARSESQIDLGAISEEMPILSAVPENGSCSLPVIRLQVTEYQETRRVQKTPTLKLPLVVEADERSL